jgi:HAD superfamily hydrolase (TIGR01509 family)
MPLQMPFTLNRCDVFGRMKINAIIWDLDGVLIDSEPYHMDAEIETFTQYGIHVPSSILKEYFGIKLENYFTDIVKRFKKEIPVEEMIHTHYETLKRYYSEVFPLTSHALDVLGQLQLQYSMGMATSREKELAIIVLKRFSLFPYFSSIIFGDDVAHGKPHPEPFIKVSSQLKVNPKTAVVIEDAVSGFIAAKKAGMFVIAREAEHNRDMDFSRADYVVEDLREIPLLLKKIG